jgi:DNA invertase Pin-like site-specific DNA recombinase
MDTPPDTLLDLPCAPEPDLVDRIFDYILADPALANSMGPTAADRHKAVLKLKPKVRAEFRGEECYIAGRPATARQEVVVGVLRLFNGRNASEVARKLNVSRATVYRYLKQPGRGK